MLGSRRARRALATVAVLLATLAGGAGGAQGASYAKGLDVSNWNGQIDWLQVAGDGYSFLFAKASEGTTFTDVTYAINRAGTQGLGLRLGAYHFARPAGTGPATIVSSAIAQADHFVDVAQPKAGDLPPVLDLETTGGLSQANLVQWTQAWLTEVTARTGVTGLIYASPSFWKNSLGDTTQFAGNGTKLWIAHWTKNASPSVPASNWDGLGWSFWQWTNCTAVPGFAHCGDGDRANGPDPGPFALRAFPSGAPSPNAPPTVSGTAKAGTKLAGVPGTWNGGKPVAFTYQWQSCDASGAGCTPIPGATLESYTPTATDVGHALVLTVTASSSRGTASASSSPTVSVAPAGSGTATAPAVITAPQVVGTLQVGQTLTASVGTWTGAPSGFAYIWSRCDATGAACAPISGATGTTYTLTPGDIGTTVSLLVTATGKGGSQSATAPTTGAIAAAPLPQAVVGSLAAQPGQAGAVITDDSRATVTWQPGVVPDGATVALAPADQPLAIPGFGLALTVSSSQTLLPWPLDVSFAAAPVDQVVGFSTDGVVWTPVSTLTSPTLPGTLAQGAYVDGTTLHVLTRVPGSVALFRPHAWGDPQQVSPHPPVIRRPEPVKVTRQRDGTLLLVTRLSSSSQTKLVASVLSTKGSSPLILKKGSRFSVPLGAGSTHVVRTQVLNAGGFPVRLRLSGNKVAPKALVRIRVTATDPWGRSGTFTLSFRAP